MTMTSGVDAPTNHHDQGAPDSLGSGSGAPRQKRRTDPEYKRSVFEDPALRRLVGSIVADRVSTMLEEAATAEPVKHHGLLILSSRLDAVASELRGQE